MKIPHEELIQEIVEIELKMFLSVPADGEYSCRQDPASFRLHRTSQFITWSEDTLKSYLEDLHRASGNNINLMTIKYARMDNLIPRENLSPFIEKITEIQYRWQLELFEKYPRLMAGARPVSSEEDTSYRTSFETYLKGELETYSEHTLELLYRDNAEMERKGINGSEKVYEYLVDRMGYPSIKDAEKQQ